MKRLLLLAAIAGCSGSSSEPPPGSVDASTDASTDPDVVVDTSADGIDDDALADALADTFPADGPSDSPADVDPFGPYPPGPYGNEVGQVVANLVWEGHLNDLADSIATTKPYDATSLDALRKKPSKGYGMIHVSEFF